MERKHQPTQTTNGPDSSVLSQATSTNATQQHSSNALDTNAGNGDGNDVAIPPNSFNFIGRLTSETHLLLISEPKVVVGRALPGTDVDFPVAANKLISRQHFLIQYCSNEFSVVCLSKNGVHMDERFLPKSDTPYKLETSCYFRFPSTNIKVIFDNLIGPTPNLGVVVHSDMMPPSVLSLLYNGPVATTLSDATVSNNFENTESNKQYHAVSPYIQNTFSKLLGPSPVSIPSSVQVGSNIEVPNAAQEITESLPSADPVNSADGKQLTSKPSSRDNNKPPYSYSQIIVQAIRASPSQQLTLAEIYTYLQETYPYFRTRSGGGWQNSIRHNLSLNPFFVKIPRTQNEVGKGNYWRIDSSVYNKTIANRYQKHKRRATIIYTGGRTGSTCSSTPVSSNLGSHSDPAPLIDTEMSLSVPGSPEYLYDEDL
ncbi:forkhead box protein K1-like [Anopheles maculipalpis]|uniref:forkhead box protein K1-like n=1 Tax=Anopheles maculipalpis TaxID=1496333 RepID=UPI0021594E71|nr:forkhead box protein K1-like [Anopheles maculipalpis]